MFLPALGNDHKMAYANKVTAVAVAMVLFLAVSMAKKAPQNATGGSICAVAIPEIVKHCYATMSVLPSEECCKDLKTASKTEKTCLCDNFFAHPDPLYSNITKVYFNQVNTACDVLDKYACNGANGGAMNMIAASVGLFGLVASLIF